jgi:short-subunit dehydrogenase
MLQVNVVSLTELTHLFGARMATQGEGDILLVASLAAYAPSPNLAAYAASKAYIRRLGEALNIEMASAVHVTVLSPGLMDTGFNAASGYETAASMRRFVEPTASVAKVGLDALFAREPSVIAGTLNRIVMAISGFLPMRSILKRRWQDAQKGNACH